MNKSPLREQFPTLVGEHFEVWISEGWLTLVTETLGLLRQEQGNMPGLRIDEIKQKWGQLVINGEGFSERANAIVDDAREKSSTICEVCGIQGDPILSRGRHVAGVRCAEHVSVKRGTLVADESNKQV